MDNVKAKLLIVDDEKIVLLGLKRIFKDDKEDK